MARIHKILMSIPVILVFLISGCSKKIDTDTASDLLRAVYEVKDYERYEEVIKNRDSIDISNLKPGINTDDTMGKGIYKPYIELYSPYMTEEGILNFFFQLYDGIIQPIKA